MPDVDQSKALTPAEARARLSVRSLVLTNIGPFDHAEVEFLPEGEDDTTVPVTIVTGENGSGKSIVIDAIRGVFGSPFARLERTITRSTKDFEATVALRHDGQDRNLTATRLESDVDLRINAQDFRLLPAHIANGTAPARRWVLDFWRSSIATDSYKIRSIEAQNHAQYLLGSLQGSVGNAQVTKLLVYFDYLRDSRDARERRAGEVLFDAARRIVQLSLLDGELLDVARTTFTPMVRQGAQTVPLGNLSSGNAYMIQRMVGLLGKMYAVNFLLSEEPEQMCQTPGVLLLDEAENHLHPRWQKRFLRDILDIFPNLQIIATTHSPFVVGSVPGARVFVCRYDPETRSARIDNVTSDYADLPVEDILSSDAFDGTEAFGQEITDLLQAREHAIESGNAPAQRAAELQLLDRNPRYFSYLRLDDHIRTLRAHG